MSHSIPGIPPFSPSLDILDYFFSTLCILVDGYFLFMLYTDKIKKNEKKNFILTSTLHLIWCNILRSLFFVIVRFSTDVSYHIFYLCSVLSAPYGTFRIGEHIWSTALAYALLYKLKSNKVDYKIPGEGFLIYLIWIVSATLSIIASSVGTNLKILPAPSYSLCSFTLHSIFVQATFWTSCFINTIILILIVYYAQKKGGKSIPFTFYLIVFLTFEYLRLPYYAYQLQAIVTNDTKLSYLARPDFKFFFISLSINWSVHKCII